MTEEEKLYPLKCKISQITNHRNCKGRKANTSMNSYHRHKTKNIKKILGCGPVQPCTLIRFLHIENALLFTYWKEGTLYSYKILTYWKCSPFICAYTFVIEVTFSRLYRTISRFLVFKNFDAICFCWNLFSILFIR